MQATIRRAQMTEVCDYQTHWCEAEGCDDEMGCSSAEPYAVIPDEDHEPSEFHVMAVIAGESTFVGGETLCLACALQRGVDEWTLDPETTLDGDTVEGIISDYGPQE